MYVSLHVPALLGSSVYAFLIVAARLGSRDIFIFACAGGSGKPDICSFYVAERLERRMSLFLTSLRARQAGCSRFRMCQLPCYAGCVHFHVFWYPSGQECVYFLDVPALLGSRMYAVLRVPVRMGSRMYAFLPVSECLRSTMYASCTCR